MTGKKHQPDEYDLNFGRVLAMTRVRFGMSQKDVAKKIGCTFQQVQKYETGANRVSVSRLYKLAACFEMSVSQLLGEATQPYITDANIFHIISTLYKMNKRGHKLVIQIVDGLVDAYSVGE